MLEPWNDSSLLPPPIHTFSGHDLNIDVNDLEYIFKTMIKVLSKQSPLHKESAICSRFIYKFDKKFRNDIGYRNFKKVNTALRKYLTLNLLKDVENFASVLPSNEDEVYLPTRQMLEYLLVRLITFSKIMLRINVCSKQSAVFYLDRVRRGESHWMCLMPYALLCRIWSMSKVLLEYTCNWYKSLYPYLNKLQRKGLNFLPDTYELPSDLEDWLGIKNIDNFGRFEWVQKRYVQADVNLIGDEDSDTLDSILKYVKEINSTSEEVEELDFELMPEKLKIVKPLIPLPKSNVDHGQAISRESFKNISQSMPVTKPKEPLLKSVSSPMQEMPPIESNTILKNKIERSPSVKKNVCAHSADEVTNKNSLQKFLSKEETFRNENSDQSLTSHLSFMQWHSLKTALLNLCDSSATDRKIGRKFQKLWQEKCLEYSS